MREQGGYTEAIGRDRGPPRQGKILLLYFFSIMKIHVNKILSSVPAALCFSVGCTRVFTRDYSIATQVVCAIVFFAIAVAIAWLHQRANGTATLEKNRFLDRVALVFGAFFAIGIVAGHAVYVDNTLHEMIVTPLAIIRSIVAVFGITVFSANATALAWAFVERRADERPAGSSRHVSARTVFAIAWAVIFASWIPTLLAFWPGVFSYDMPAQAAWALSGIYSSHHPPIHTWIVGLCLNAEGFLGLRGITIYELLQTVILSASLAVLIGFLHERRAPRWLLVASVAFFACPLTSVMAICPTKDNFFAAFFIVLLIQLCRFVSRQSQSAHVPTLVSISVLALACCLFRNNFVYALAVVAALALAAFPGRRTVVVALAIPVAMAFVISGPVYRAMGIHEGSMRELLPLPINQISRVLANERDTLSDDDIANINVYFDADAAAEKYNPRFADPTKDLFTAEKVSLADFIRLWANIGMRHPNGYLYAALSLNLPYWYLGAPPVDCYAQRDYLEVDNFPDPNAAYYVELSSKLPAYHDFLYGLATFETLEAIPLARVLFSLATPLWILLFCMCSLIARNPRKWNRTFIYLLSLAFLLTFFLGPVSNMRYLIPLYLAMPLYLYAFAFPERLFLDESAPKDGTSTLLGGVPGQAADACTSS